MLKVDPYQFWFVTGSQHLYGPDVIEEVSRHSESIVDKLNESVPFKIVPKPVLTTADGVKKICMEANSDPLCAGIITWMHTFSPAKMWIGGLLHLVKPLMHLHTQYNRDIPWDSIDMDFMNLNQSAHGDREYGFIGSRLKVARKIVVGHYSDPEVVGEISEWMYTSVAHNEGQKMSIARFGDNMRDVAVTEGDKVEAQIKFGWSINGYALGDLTSSMEKVSQGDVDKLVQEYKEKYRIASSDCIDSIRYQARIEIGLKMFLEAGGHSAFTTTFENLNGLKQLPGLAVQRLMEQGYGFGAEGDWKTAGLLRIMKLMDKGAGTSFMEDYTYHLESNKEMVLGAHMLEVCPSIAESIPNIEVHPLSIGGKESPARMVFQGRPGRAINASLIDLGHRFRLLINEVQALEALQPMPKLPVARVLWRPEPSFKTALKGWLLAGGAHHTVFSYGVTTQNLIDWAQMVGIECVVIDQSTILANLSKELIWNEAVF